MEMINIWARSTRISQGTGTS